MDQGVYTEKPGVKKTLNRKKITFTKYNLRSKDRRKPLDFSDCNLSVPSSVSLGERKYSRTRKRGMVQCNGGLGTAKGCDSEN